MAITIRALLSRFQNSYVQLKRNSCKLILVFHHQNHLRNVNFLSYGQSLHLEQFCMTFATYRLSESHSIKQKESLLVLPYLFNSNFRPRLMKPENVPTINADLLIKAAMGHNLARLHQWSTSCIDKFYFALPGYDSTHFKAFRGANFRM